MPQDLRKGRVAPYRGLERHRSGDPGGQVHYAHYFSWNASVCSLIYIFHIGKKKKTNMMVLLSTKEIVLANDSLISSLSNSRGSEFT